MLQFKYKKNNKVTYFNLNFLVDFVLIKKIYTLPMGPTDDTEKVRLARYRRLKIVILNISGFVIEMNWENKIPIELDTNLIIYYVYFIYIFFYYTVLPLNIFGNIKIRNTIDMISESYYLIFIP